MHRSIETIAMNISLTHRARAITNRDNLATLEARQMVRLRQNAHQEEIIAFRVLSFNVQALSSSMTYLKRESRSCSPLTSDNGPSYTIPSPSAVVQPDKSLDRWELADAR
jgi:hypothetical protein